jgi:hypothetical protein
MVRHHVFGRGNDYRCKWYRLGASGLTTSMPGLSFSFDFVGVSENWYYHLLRSASKWYYHWGTGRGYTHASGHTTLYCKGLA